MKNACGFDHGSHKLSRRGILSLGAAAGVSSFALPAFAEKGMGQKHGGGRLLFKNATVLSIDPSIGNMTPGDVLVKNGKIEQVGYNLSAHGAWKIDLTGKIIMPGFVDTHRHMWQGLLRNIASDDLLLDYLNSILFGFAPVINPDEIYIGNLVTALSAANAGITTVLDWSHIATSPDHTDAAIDGLESAGIRAVYGYGPNFGKPPAWYEDLNNPYPGDLYRLAEQRFSSSDQLLTLALAAAGPEFSNVEAAAYEWQIARDVGVPISVHVGVGEPGSHDLLTALAAQVSLGDDTTYIHACTLTEQDFQLIADTGGKLSIAAPVELQMGHGMPPIQRALDAGIRPSLSIDVETNQPTDMFTQMRNCFALQRGLINQEQLFPDTSLRHRMLTAQEMLEFATIEGARANGLESKVGSLTPGKEADFIILDAQALNVAPINDPVGAVVLGMDTSNVEAVFVAGKPLKWNHRMVGVNVPNIISHATQAQIALYERAGQTPPGG